MFQCFKQRERECVCAWMCVCACVRLSQRVERKRENECISDTVTLTTKFSKVPPDFKFHYLELIILKGVAVAAAAAAAVAVEE